MKKIKALILGTCRSSGTIFGGIFFGITVIIWVIAALAPSAVQTTIFVQSFGFFFIALFGETLFIQDQFTGALVLPISGQQFVTAKLLQIAALLAGSFAVLSAIFWGMLVFSRAAWDVSIFYIPAALFPICCTFFMLLFTLMLLGKPPILIGLWMLCCGAPGFVSGFFASWKTTLYENLVAVLPALQAPRPVGLLLALYLVCAALTFMLYKLSVRNFNKLQYNRFLSVERRR
ncbi:MAG: hypothetical protein ACTTJ7_06980 [Treponema sp.]